VEYKTNSDVFLAGLNFIPRKNHSFSLNLSYTASDASFDPVDFPEPAETSAIGYYDFSRINTFSDLKIKQLDLVMTSRHGITEHIGLDFGFAFKDYNDDELYLFDGSGSLYLLSAGMTYSF
jgi:hypothetical protein